MTLTEIARHDKALMPPPWAVRRLYWSDDGRTLFAPPWRLDVATALWTRFEPDKPPRLKRAKDDGLPSGFVGRSAVPMPGNSRWVITRAYRPPGRGVEQAPPPADRTAELVLVLADGTAGPPLWFGLSEPPTHVAAGRGFVTAVVDHHLKVWHAGSRSEAAAIAVGTVGALAIHAVQGAVAIAESSRVSVCRDPDWTAPTRLEGHTNPVTALAFDPVRPLLASGSHDDGEVRLWNLDSGDCVATASPGAVVDLAFSPDGIRLVCAVSTAAGQIVELDVTAPSGVDAPIPADSPTADEPAEAPATESTPGIWARIKRWFSR